jgi:hypothetical protein
MHIAYEFAYFTPFKSKGSSYRILNSGPHRVTRVRCFVVSLVLGTKQEFQFIVYKVYTTSSIGRQLINLFLLNRRMHNVSFIRKIVAN